ncbi:hypothetical protein PHAMO_280045 [Magnetospirillum molischianum DSM 120]|uniref:Uncharacterized protein n=1 Tax=Magnetospirillum molischianum DSM 120 TaxID=1150626 RepID=H8FT23_MAGML|nr:hypothetical protein PHAMO_280045 [Magnetospirillum molischianum DSM 120]
MTEGTTNATCAQLSRRGAVRHGGNNFCLLSNRDAEGSFLPEPTVSKRSRRPHLMPQYPRTLWISLLKSCGEAGGSEGLPRVLVCARFLGMEWESIFSNALA